MNDDNTLDNAGEVGRQLADKLSERVQEAIDGFPESGSAQRAAIARIAANNLYDYANELEEG